MSTGVDAFETVPAALERVLDRTWLSWALGRRVLDVAQVVSTATLAQKVLFRAVLADGELTLCVKGHFDGGRDTMRSEALFYRDLRPALAMRTPVAHYAAHDDDAGRSLVIMDDVVAGGGRFLRADDPFDLPTCRSSLAELARLHGATWGAAAPDTDWLTPRVATMHRMFPDGALQALLDDGRAETVAPVLRDERRLRAALETVGGWAPTCVIHADTHSNNVYVDGDDRTGWLDWQVVQRGHWAVDVAYHLATTLDVASRRAHEADLLHHYLDALASAGVGDGPAFDDAWRAYTSAFVHGYLLWVITRVASRDWVLLNVPRLATAMTDHDTYGRLGVA